MTRTCTLSKREGLRCLKRHIETQAECASPGSTATDAVHDLRVACRRGRVILAEFRENFPPAARRAARRRLRKAGRHLGRVREVDVSLSLLDRWANADPTRTATLVEIRDRLEAERQAAVRQVEALFEKASGGNFAELFAQLEAGFQPSTACHLRHARKRLAKRLKRVRLQHRVWRKTHADEDLHLLRIRFKMLRYSLEIYRGLYGNPSKKFLEALIAAQDALGQWNDFRLLRDRVRHAAADASSPVREGLADLEAAIETDVIACAAALDEQLGPFAIKGELRRAEKLLARPKRPCCRGAR